MKNQELFYEAFSCEMIEMSRKPGNLAEVTDTNFQNLPEAVKEALTALPEYDYTEYYNQYGFFANVLGDDEQFHIITIDELVFFVDTQGYGYPRYVTRLRNIHPQIQD